MVFRRLRRGNVRGRHPTRRTTRSESVQLGLELFRALWYPDTLVCQSCHRGDVPRKPRPMSWLQCHLSVTGARTRCCTANTGLQVHSPRTTDNLPRRGEIEGRVWRSHSRATSHGGDRVTTYIVDARKCMNPFSIILQWDWQIRVSSRSIEMTAAGLRGDQVGELDIGYIVFWQSGYHEDIRKTFRREWH